MYVRPRKHEANDKVVLFDLSGKRYRNSFGCLCNDLPMATRSTDMDISEGSPAKAQCHVIFPTAIPISNVRRPCTLSTTSETVPSRIASPFSMRRVDHSCSRIVWCRRTSAWRTDDFPDALEPDSNVRWPRGSFSVSKHLKFIKSSLLIIKYLLKHLLGQIKPFFNYLHIVCTVGYGSNEIIIIHNAVKSLH